ncbi:hypothetical protein [Leifsonia shinshuensis]
MSATITTDRPTGTPAEEVELETTLTFAYDVAFRGIAAVVPHIAKDDMSRIINGVLVSPTEFVGTDRYSAVRWTHGTAIHPDTDSVVLPRAAAEWLGKQTPRALGLSTGALTQQLRVRVTDHDIAIFWVHVDESPLATMRFEPVSGNYPPVLRLIDGFTPSEEAYSVLLDGDKLARFATSRKKSGTAAPLRVELGECSARAKSAPIRVTFGDHFAGLLQPNLEV